MKEKKMSYAGGEAWFVNRKDGRIRFASGLDQASDKLERWLREDRDGYIRTKGSPKTAATLARQYGEIITEAAEEFDVPAELVAGVIMCESGRVDGRYDRDMISERHEPGFVTWHETPHRGSAGLGQQLLTTARSVVQHFDLEEMFVDPWGNEREVQVGDLIVPHWGIFFAAGYLRMLADKEDTLDPILLSAGYNAGGVYKSRKNDFRLRVYGGADRFLKHAAYSNDWLAVTG